MVKIELERTRATPLKGRGAFTASDCDLLDQRHFPLNQVEECLFRGTAVALRREVLRDSCTTSRTSTNRVASRLDMGTSPGINTVSSPLSSPLRRVVDPLLRGIL
jgi:hypothetical protein